MGVDGGDLRQFAFRRDVVADDLPQSTVDDVKVLLSKVIAKSMGNAVTPMGGKIAATFSRFFQNIANVVRSPAMPSF